MRIPSWSRTSLTSSWRQRNCTRWKDYTHASIDLRCWQQSSKIEWIGIVKRWTWSPNITKLYRLHTHLKLKWFKVKCAVDRVCSSSSKVGEWSLPGWKEDDLVLGGCCNISRHAPVLSVQRSLRSSRCCWDVTLCDWRVPNHKMLQQMPDELRAIDTNIVTFAVWTSIATLPPLETWSCVNCATSILPSPVLMMLSYSLPESNSSFQMMINFHKFKTFINIWLILIIYFKYSQEFDTAWHWKTVTAQNSFFWFFFGTGMARYNFFRALWHNFWHHSNTSPLSGFKYELRATTSNDGQR